MGSAVCLVRNLRVKYGFRVAVDDVSFDVSAGEGVALLGLNGAGKSSIVRSLLGIRAASSGLVEVLGSRDPRLQLKHVGYCPEDAMPPEFLSVGEYLRFISRLKGVGSSRIRQQVDEILQTFELSADRRIVDLSKGMTRRVVLAQAFIGDQKFLVLDEPLNGLDPIMIVGLRERINRFRESGGAVLYSSHLLSEVERCCTSVVFLNGGRVSGVGPMAKFVKEHESLENAFLKLAGKSSGGSPVLESD